MISSEVRVAPSRNRTRPDSAIKVASNPTLGLDGGRPRRSARLAATAAASMAPRTDDPMRTSGCVLVRRTSSTILPVHAASTDGTAGAARPTIAASSSALW